MTTKCTLLHASTLTCHPQGACNQYHAMTLHSPGDFSLGLVTFSGPPIHRTLLQQTFLWGYLTAQVFTHALPDTNSLKNAIRQDIANVTQDTLRHVMASVPGRWQQCLIVMEDIS
jgi:hypothetical protein